MNLTHARLIHRFAVVTGFVALVVAFGAMQFAPAPAAGPLATADSPAPDDGGDSSDGGSDPTEDPEPSQEPTTEPTQAATPAAGTDGSASDSSDNNNEADESADSGDSGNDDSTSNSDDNDRTAGGGAAVLPSDSADGSTTDPTEAREDTAEPAKRGWSSSLGWVLLIGGLASAGGAFAVYRRHPEVIRFRSRPLAT